MNLSTVMVLISSLNIDKQSPPGVFFSPITLPATA